MMEPPTVNDQGQQDRESRFEALNVLTNIDGVKNALKSIGDWEERHDTLVPYSLASAAQEIMERREAEGVGLGTVLPLDQCDDGEGAAIVYGKDGINRYLVEFDGNISYSESHGKADVNIARELGFPIIPSSSA